MTGSTCEYRLRARNEKGDTLSLFVSRTNQQSEDVVSNDTFSGWAISVDGEGVRVHLVAENAANAPDKSVVVEEARKIHTAALSSCVAEGHCAPEGSEKIDVEFVDAMCQAFESKTQLYGIPGMRAWLAALTAMAPPDDAKPALDSLVQGLQTMIARGEDPEADPTVKLQYPPESFRFLPPPGVASRLLEVASQRQGCDRAGALLFKGP